MTENTTAPEVKKADKTISLNISERLAALSILNDFKGSLVNLATILDDIKGFAITDEEWTQAERTIEKIDEDKNQWKWNDDKGGLKEIGITKTTAEYLRNTIETKDKAGEFGLKDHAYITLSTKLV